MSGRHRYESPGGIRRLPGWGRVSIALLLLVGSGCGSRAETEAISGNVTWKGQPLDQGTIEFAPVDGGLGVAVLTIKDGSYELPHPPGLAPGMYQVRISSRKGSRPSRPDIPDADIGDPTVKEQLPPKYNLESKLQAEVKKGGGNSFDFRLE